MEADDELPFLPAKDLTQRIFRDVRFSDDKTPYRTHLSFSISRSGRGGDFAGYYFQIGPHNSSLLCAGSSPSRPPLFHSATLAYIRIGKWGPEKTQLANIRRHLTRSPQMLRDIIGQQDFVRLFGPPEPSAKQNVFGQSDMLKVGIRHSVFQRC